MKKIVVLLSIALLASPAMAQGKGRRGDPSAATKPEDAAKKKAANAAYEQALKSIPDSKVKVDPWSGAR